MSETVRISQATVADLEQLLPLFDAYRQFYQQASDLAGAKTYLQKRLERQEAIIFLAYAAAMTEHPAPVGFALLYQTFSSVPMQPLTILNDLYTVPAARGQGVASALIAACRANALAQGAFYLRLRTAYDNIAAQRLYQALGFVRDDVYWTYNLKPG
jgi:ribosomal protein S18 acetylase RimI-like enzyme